MSREQFDNTFSLFQLSEIIHSHQSTSQVKKLLKTFSCTRNRDLEDENISKIGTKILKEAKKLNK